MPSYRCAYVIYLNSTPSDVWAALTDPQQTAAYWAHHNVSDWQAGSAWEHQRADGSGVADIAGTVIESSDPARLVLTWAHPGDGTPVAGADVASEDQRADGRPSRVSIDIEPYHNIVRLTVTQEDLASEAERDALAAGWAAVLSNLKSFLETGRALPTPPWDMLPGFVRAD
jgi:uncharacterized protein YndB with AHSA1/START domain